MAQGSDAIGILLALAKEDSTIRIFQDFRQAVEDATLTLFPNPTTVAIRPALAEAFGLQSHDLIEQCPVGIDIVIGGDVPRMRGTTAIRLECRQS